MRLQNKILIVILNSIIIPLFILSVFDYYYLHNQNIKNEVNLLKSDIELISQSISEPLWDLSIDNIRKQITIHQSSKNLSRIDVYDQNKNLFFTTDTKSELNIKSFNKLSSPIMHSDKTIGSIDIFYTEANLDSGNLNQFIFRTIELLFATSLGGLIIAYFMKTKVVSKLEILNSQAREIDNLNLEDQFQWNNEDEISKIGQTLEKVRLSFKNYIETEKKHKETLQSINSNLENEVKYRTEQVIQSSKLASLGEMASGIAHEINNPLAIIAGKSQNMLTLLKRGSVNPNDFLPHVEKVKSTTERIAKIVRGLKNQSRFDDGTQKETISIQKLFDEVIELSRERFKKLGVEVQSVIDPSLHIFCSPIQIEQVLTNLLNNAYDAISDLPDKWIIVETYVDNLNSNPNVCVRVIDSGPAITQETANKIFQPFYTTKKVGKGTGLGLSISSKIIEEHGGKLFVESNRPNATFTFRMPLKEVGVGQNKNPNSQKAA